jgi:hypothetical protein
MCGKNKTVDIHIQTRQIPSELKTGDYENDRHFRVNFQHWINQIWQEKDARLEDMSQKYD